MLSRMSESVSANYIFNLNAGGTTPIPVGLKCKVGLGQIRRNTSGSVHNVYQSTV